MSFVFKIDDAFRQDGSLVLRGRLRSGVMHASQRMRLPTTLGVDVVATIMFMRVDRLGIGWWRELDISVEVYLIGCWLRADLIRRELVEFTLFRQSRMVDQLLEEYVREHGSSAVYAE
jgi:hypothetical protein